jgi:hypothetical protein
VKYIYNLDEVCIPRISDEDLFLADVFLAEELTSDEAEGGLNPAVVSFGVWTCN